MRRCVAIFFLMMSGLYVLGCHRAQESPLKTDRRAAAYERAVTAQLLPPPPAVPMPVEYLGTPLANRMGGLHISEPQTHGKLTLYPIFASQPAYPHRIHTIETAYHSKGLKMTDGRAGTVATISLDKTTNDEVFIMNGEMLVGGSQNRLTKADQLLPRKAGQYKLQAYCIELGRERGPSKAFRTAGVIAPHTLRRMGIAGTEQSKIWKWIGRKTAQLKAKTRTKNLGAVYRTKRYRRLAAPYEVAFQGFTARFKDAIGVAALINDKVVSVDVFANRGLFADTFPKLLRSFVLDATDPKFTATGVPEPQLMQFLGELRIAKYKPHTGKRHGRSYGLKSARAVGSVLIAHEDLIHLVLMPTPKETS